jgi:DNA-binding transcriptional LysR family regulator
MQFKWMEDLVALAKICRFSRAAELRNVTHPAFGRRIKALEDWSGAALVERGNSPITLTPAGARLLQDARDLLQGIEQARDALQSAAGRRERTVTLATGRTLARTWVADWLVRLHPLLSETSGELHRPARSLAETVQMPEHGSA